MSSHIDPLHEQGTDHWILTLEGVGSRSGTCTPLAGETRYDLYLRIRGAVLDEESLADAPIPVTLFFDLQSNTTEEANVKAIKHIASETWATLRYMVTGRTVSRRNARALDEYWQYQARERAAEARGER